MMGFAIMFLLIVTAYDFVDDGPENNILQQEG